MTIFSYRQENLQNEEVRTNVVASDDKSTLVSLKQEMCGIFLQPCRYLKSGLEEDKSFVEREQCISEFKEGVQCRQTQG